jgi:hypothetical protein
MPNLPPDNYKSDISDSSKDETTTLNRPPAIGVTPDPIPSSFAFPCEDTLSPAADEAAKAMAAALEQQPELCRCGFYHYQRASNMSPADYKVFFQQEREALLEAAALQQFRLARLWLRQFPKSGRFHPGSGSYSLKHLCEQEVGLYITNGALIAAAVAEKFSLQRVSGTPNCLIAVSLIDKLPGLELRLQALEVGRMLGMVIVDGCC